MAKMSFSDMLSAIPIPTLTTPGELAKIMAGGKLYTVQAKFSALPGCEVFELFNDLPRELRTKIWGFAAEARGIAVIEIPKTKSAAELTGDETAVEFSKFKIEGASYPSIFYVCKEVKELAVAMGYRPMFQVHGSSKLVYFNSCLDVLDIQTEWVRNDLCDPLELSKVFVNPSELQFVQQLHIPLPCFHLHTLQVTKHINELTSLKALHLHSHFDTFPSHPEFTLKLDFEDFEGKGVVPIAKIPGNHLVGKDAMASVYAYVTARYQQDHIIELWKLIKHSMGGSKPFPASVKIEVTYVALPI